MLIDPQRVHWFGPTWRAAICDPDYEIETPVGQLCIECNHAIRVGDQGVSLNATAIPDPSMPPSDRRAVAHIRCFVAMTTKALIINPLIR